MDYRNLLKLKRNPHYKMSKSQRLQLEEYEREEERKRKPPVARYGVRQTHKAVLKKRPYTRNVKTKE